VQGAKRGSNRCGTGAFNPASFSSLGPVMASEPPNLFDPRRNTHVQGFTGRGATTTVHDASETGISISGIFLAAEDFAVLCLYNAYDHFNHLRLKPLPRKPRYLLDRPRFRTPLLASDLCTSERERA